MLFPCSVECRTLVCERNLFVLYERAFVALYCRTFEWKGGDYAPHYALLHLQFRIMSFIMLKEIS